MEFLWQVSSLAVKWCKMSLIRYSFRAKVCNRMSTWVSTTNKFNGVLNTWISSKLRNELQISRSKMYRPISYLKCDLIWMLITFYTERKGILHNGNVIPLLIETCIVLLLSQGHLKNECITKLSTTLESLFSKPISTPKDKTKKKTSLKN